jgi:hypothetical protein
MDQALKERRLGSAAARRKKMEERERERQQRHQKMSGEARERKIKELLDHSSDDEDLDEENDNATSGTTSEPDLDYASSVQTPSDSSLLTPDDLPSPLVVRRRKPNQNFVGDVTGGAPGQLQISLLVDSQQNKNNTIHVESPSSPSPVLQSSLVTLSDWNYERFSAVLNPDKVQEDLAAEDFQYPYSPIEVATPISYSLPKVRPSVVSICSISSNRKSQTPKSPKRETHLSRQSAFPASEATPFRLPSSPTKPSRTSSNAYPESQLQKSYPQGAKFERKSSAPLLTGTSRFSRTEPLRKADQMVSASPHIRKTDHLRLSPPMPGSMHGLRSNTPLSPQESEHCRTSMPFDRRVEHNLRRPSTGYGQVSQQSQPSTNTTPATTSKPSALHIARKKSISALRSSSESIGQALRSVKAKGRLSIRPDVDTPPVPILIMPKPDQSLDLSFFPLPPPRSSLRTARDSVTSSASSPVIGGLAWG